MVGRTVHNGVLVAAHRAALAQALLRPRQLPSCCHSVHAATMLTRPLVALHRPPEGLLHDGKGVDVLAHRPPRQRMCYLAVHQRPHVLLMQRPRVCQAVGAHTHVHVWVWVGERVGGVRQVGDGGHTCVGWL